MIAGTATFMYMDFMLLYYLHITADGGNIEELFTYFS